MFWLFILLLWPFAVLFGYSFWVNSCSFVCSFLFVCCLLVCGLISGLLLFVIRCYYFLSIADWLLGCWLICLDELLGLAHDLIVCGLFAALLLFVCCFIVSVYLLV